MLLLKVTVLLFKLSTLRGAYHSNVICAPLIIIQIKYVIPTSILCYSQYLSNTSATAPNLPLSSSKYASTFSPNPAS